ncbi:MAG TPA: hypothetical protein DER70_16890 [Lentisphaeria bacterium]|nr:hypothetical protein [Lentisphaeria bacterium]
MSIASVVWVGILIFWIIDAIISPSGLQIGLLLVSLLSLFSVPPAWRLIKTRAQEDENWEPDITVCTEEKMLKIQRRAAVLSVLSMIPGVGFIFAFIAICMIIWLLFHKRSLVKLIPQLIFIALGIFINIAIIFWDSF